MTTVLFVHGLESGPHGNKSRQLAAAGYDVVAVQMPSNQYAWLRDSLVWLSVLVFLAAFVVAAYFDWRFALAFVVVFVGATPMVRIGLMRRMFSRSLAVQIEALRAHKIDVVIGSSFGGAVALELVRRGTWQGPTILLCPAQEMIAERTRKPTATLPKELPSKVLVVHGRQDALVPFAHSENLVRGTTATLLAVDDDHRLTQNAVAERFREWVEMVTHA